MLKAIVIASLGLAGLTPSTALALTLERITIAADPTLATSAPLIAYLAKPASANIPTAAIVGLHGCSGVVGPAGKILPIYLDWAERWVAAGYAVIFPDSFGSRGIGPQCTVKERQILPRDRAADAATAARWLQSQATIDPKRLALVGWSHGGSSTLWTVRPEAAIGANDFKAAIAFYPGCSVLAKQRGWQSRLPLTILMGAADDWTPAVPCRGLGTRPNVRYVEYPDAYHAFDHPNLPVRVRTGLTFTAKGDGIAHIGTNSAARAAAISDVERILAAALK
jgi:dienelactone hydrolase